MKKILFTQQQQQLSTAMNRQQQQQQLFFLSLQVPFQEIYPLPLKDTVTFEEFLQNCQEDHDLKKLYLKNLYSTHILNRIERFQFYIDNLKIFLKNNPSRESRMFLVPADFLQNTVEFRDNIPKSKYEKNTNYVNTHFVISVYFISMLKQEGKEGKDPNSNVWSITTEFNEDTKLYIYIYEIVKDRSFCKRNNIIL